MVERLNGGIAEVPEQTGFDEAAGQLKETPMRYLRISNHRYSSEKYRLYHARRGTGELAENAPRPEWHLLMLLRMAVFSYLLTS